ncbi:MAG: hypothetical protein LBP62_06080 [Clostridiales bacterium]|jgi:hypothetical protein|nr:hypothetical protein [Clostridiales bacterium]
MEIEYKNSAICFAGRLYEEAAYDAGNLVLNAQFDGGGGIARYAVINKFEAFDFFHILFSLNGRALDGSEKKTVEMIGGKAVIRISAAAADVEIRQFITRGDNAVFFRFKVSAKEDIDFRAAVNFGVDYKSYIQEFFLSRFKPGGVVKAAFGVFKKHIAISDSAIKNDLLGDFYIDFAADNPLEPMERNAFYVNQFKTAAAVKKGEEKTIGLVVSAGERRDFSEAFAEELIGVIGEKEREADEYIESLKKNAEKYVGRDIVVSEAAVKNGEKDIGIAKLTPKNEKKYTEKDVENTEKNSGKSGVETLGTEIQNSEKDIENSDESDTEKNSGKSGGTLGTEIQNSEKDVENYDEKNSENYELKKALYASCLNCALSNYKEKGKFKALLAGIVYQFPARTYFRDGYWTALPLAAVRPDIVRNQILTLARGIGKKGECPSAVKSTFKNYWGNHYDSPSFFVMLVRDYIANAGDIGILFEKIRGKTILEYAESVIRRLEAETDETGLLVKSGKYNRRDWCDNVFRTGYATYDEALYARALFCMSDIFSALCRDIKRLGELKKTNGNAADGVYERGAISGIERLKTSESVPDGGIVCGEKDIGELKKANGNAANGVYERGAISGIERLKTNGSMPDGASGRGTISGIDGLKENKNAEYLNRLRVFSLSKNEEEDFGQKSAEYQNKYEIVKKAINDILFDEKKGYFVNYKDGETVEDNLSIDTVLIALFGLSTRERILSMLKNMEKILETKNNSEQVLGDFGVLSVYPFYKAEAVVQKSSLPYYYHNGGDWPYLSAAYAYAKLIFGMDYDYPLTRWFDYNAKKGNFTPVEFFSPARKRGSLMQGWSAMGAFLFNHKDGKFFENRVDK